MRGNIFHLNHSLANIRLGNVYTMDDDGLSSPVVDAISCQVQNAVASTQQDLLSNIITLMDCRLTSLQTNITHSQQEIAQTQLAKMEEAMTENYTFQRKRKRE